ncbi:unnamed protein product, partial [Closterium sp. NIES-53]
MCMCMFMCMCVHAYLPPPPGMVTNSACVLPVGAFLDAYGPRITAITGSLVFSAGLLALALGSAFSHPPPPAPPPALLMPSPSASLLSMPPAFLAYESHHTQSPLLLRPLPPPWPLHYCPHHFELSDNRSHLIAGRRVEGPPEDSAWDGGGMAARGEGGRRGGEGIRGMTEGLGWVAEGLRGAKKGVGFAGVCFFAAFFLLALGGPFILTPMINFSELLPSSSAAVIAAQSGAFDASAALLFLFALAVSRLHFALSSVCLAYLVVPLAIAAVAAITFPDALIPMLGLYRSLDHHPSTSPSPHHFPSFFTQPPSFPLSPSPCPRLCSPFGASPASEPHTTPPSASTLPSSTSLQPDSLSLLTAPLLQPASKEHSSEVQASKEQPPQSHPFGASPASEPHTTPPSASTLPSSTSLQPDSLSLLTAPLLQPASKEHSSEVQASKEQPPQSQSDEEEGARGQGRPAVGRREGGSEVASGEEEGRRGTREGMGAGLTAVGRRDEEGGRTGGSREGRGGPRRSGELERLYLLRLMGTGGSDKAAAGNASGTSTAAAADELTTSACHVALPAVTGRGSIPLSPNLPIVWLHGRSTPCLPPPPAIYNGDIATQL